MIRQRYPGTARASDSGMSSYLIARIEPAANRYKPQRECEVPLQQVSVRRRSQRPLSRQEIASACAPNGVEVSPIGAGWKDFDLLVLAYTSPRKDGVGRAGSQLFRLPARAAARSAE